MQVYPGVGLICQSAYYGVVPKTQCSIPIRTNNVMTLAGNAAQSRAREGAGPGARTLEMAS